MTASAFETAMSNAASAYAGGDYSGAIAYAVQGLALMPAANVSRNLSGGGAQSITWNSASILAFIQQCKIAKTSAAHAVSGPFQQIDVTYAAADDVDEYA